MERSLACQVIARLAAFAPEISQAAEAASELDCILALAAAARELNLCRPQVDPSGCGVQQHSDWPCVSAPSTAVLPTLCTKAAGAGASAA